MRGDIMQQMTLFDEPPRRRTAKKTNKKKRKAASKKKGRKYPYTKTGGGVGLGGEITSKSTYHGSYTTVTQTYRRNR